MVTEDFNDGLAAGTRSAYTKAIKRLARFGLQIGLVHNGWLLPPSELDLMFWVSQLAHVEGLSPGYIVPSFPECRILSWSGGALLR
jgi:hypothetical protein